VKIQRKKNHDQGGVNWGEGKFGRRMYNLRKKKKTGETEKKKKKREEYEAEGGEKSEIIGQTYPSTSTIKRETQ